MRFFRANRLTRVSLAALLALASLPAAAQFKLNASFRNTTEPGWTIAGSNNTGNNDSGILTGGYGLIADGNNTNDAVGNGWLRLTTDQASQVGNALYTGGTFPSSQGVIVDFDYVSWSGTGADGISFFLYDASQNMAGALSGAGLGYCNGAGGYLGVGLDEFGNFSGQAPGVTGGCSSLSGSPGGVGADMVVVRGPLGANNVFIARTSAPGGIDDPTTAVRPAADRARVLLIPNGSGGYRVTVGLGQNGAAITNVLTNLNFPYVAPAQLRMGFGAATGGLNNIHEVRGVVTSTPADVGVTKTVSGTRLFPGQAVVYTVTVVNNDVNPVDAGNQAPTIDAANAPDILDTLPAQVSGATWTCSASAGSTCPAASGSGSLAIAGGYTLAPGGTLTFTVSGTVAAGATCGSRITNTVGVNFSSTDGFSDLDASDNSASVGFDIACADLSIVKSDGRTTYVPGQPLTYAVTISNVGPDAVPGAVLTDPAVAGLTVSSVSCTGTTGGATCPAPAATTVAALQGAGIVLPAIPVGGTVSFAVTGTVAVGTSGPLTNTARVAMTGGRIDSATGNNTASDTNLRAPILRLRKTLPLGRFGAGDQFALDIGGAANVVTTGTGATATGTATLDPAVAGTAYTLTESAAGGANLANYTTTYACTNARVGGQTPSGNGTSFTVTPVPADDLTCTFVNRRRPLADVWITKTNTPGMNANVDLAGDTLISGTSTSYVLVVGNTGPDAANGSVVADTIGSRLTCTAVACAAAGGASCPTQTGAALLAALGGAGATIPQLPNGGTVTFTLTCGVQ